MITRRNFLKTAIMALGFFFPNISISTEKGSIGSYFCGEELRFIFSFWLLKKTGVARTLFMPLGKNRYHICLKGETSGIAKIISRHRRDEYHALVREVDNGRRLETIISWEKVKIGKRLYEQVARFDYSARSINVTKFKNGKKRKEYQAKLDIRGGDYLTSVFNFRYGTFGPCNYGTTLSLPTFFSRKKTHLDIFIASIKETFVRRKKLGLDPRCKYLIKTKLNKKRLKSNSGWIEGWLDKNMVPIYGILEDIFLFGDIKARLVSKRYLKSSQMPDIPLPSLM